MSTDTEETRPWHIALEAAVANVPHPPSTPYAEMMCHGTMSAGLYMPSRVDKQKRHDQDEIYVIMRGHGELVRGEERARFEPGDMLMVPAGMEHRFENFTDDLTIWVMFWGTKGGEGAADG